MNYRYNLYCTGPCGFTLLRLWCRSYWSWYHNQVLGHFHSKKAINPHLLLLPSKKRRSPPKRKKKKKNVIIITWTKCPNIFRNWQLHIFYVQTIFVDYFAFLWRASLIRLVRPRLWQTEMYMECNRPILSCTSQH